METKPKWLLFEQLTATLWAGMDADCEVIHNCELTDRKGFKRKYDVVLRRKAMGTDLLGVIECKDLKRPVGLRLVQAFERNAASVGANVKIMASSSGFTRDAMAWGDEYNIILVTPAAAPGKPGLVVRQPCYASIYSWSKIKIAAHAAEPSVILPDFAAEELLFASARISDWFRKLLMTDHPSCRILGWHRLGLRFREPLLCHIGEFPYLVDTIIFSALRERSLRTSMAAYTGDAIFYWNTGRYVLPNDGKTFIELSTTNFDEWKEIPDSQRITVEPIEISFELDCGYDVSQLQTPDLLGLASHVTGLEIATESAVVSG